MKPMHFFAWCGSDTLAVKGAIQLRETKIVFAPLKKVDNVQVFQKATKVWQNLLVEYV